MGIIDFLNSIIGKEKPSENLSDDTEQHVSTEVSEKDIEDINTLCAASFCDNIELAEDILNNALPTFDINGSFSSNLTPIMYTSFFGHSELAQRLLQHGANLNMKDTFMDSGRTPLIFASQQGHTDLVEFFILNGADPDETDTRHYTALMTAAEAGHNEVVQVLIKNNADLEKQSHLEKTALMISAECNRPDITKLLIEAGTALNTKSLCDPGSHSIDCAALHFAVESGSLEIVKLLTEAGADIAIENHYGSTPLKYAIDLEHVEIIDYLLKQGENIDFDDPDLILNAFKHEKIALGKFFVENGADIDFSYNLDYSSDGEKSPFTVAIRQHDYELVDLILSKDPMYDIETHEKDGLLHDAVITGHLGVIQMLVEAGLDLENGTKYSPVNEAIERGQEEVVKLLIELGATINPKIDSDGESALITAASIGNISMMRLLIQNGAATDHKTLETALRTAIGENHIEAIGFLIENGANTDNFGSYDEIMLLQFARNGNFNEFKALLDKGPLTNLPDDQYLAVINCAAENGHFRIVELILETTENPEQYNTALVHSIHKGYLDITKLLISKGANLEQIDLNDGSLLIDMIRHNHPEMAIFLIENEASTDGIMVERNAQIWQDYERDWPLIFAASKGQIGVVEMLLEKGADVNALDQYGDTALLRAAKAGHIDVCKVLLENDANIDEENYHGYTPLMEASSEGHSEIVILLLEAGADVQHFGQGSDTPIRRAYDNNHKKVIDILMFAGADYSRRWR